MREVGFAFRYVCRRTIETSVLWMQSPQATVGKCWTHLGGGKVIVERPIKDVGGHLVAQCGWSLNQCAPKDDVDRRLAHFVAPHRACE